MRYDEFKNYVVEAAKNSGLKEYELYYKESESVSTETLMHEISGFSTSGGAGACFRCIHEGKMGYASTELFTAEEAARIVADAMENASIIEIEDEVFIHEAGDNYVELEPQKTYEPTSAEMIEKAKALENAVYAEDERVMDGSQAFFGFGKKKEEQKAEQNIPQTPVAEPTQESENDAQKKGIFSIPIATTPAAEPMMSNEPPTPAQKVSRCQNRPSSTKVIR